MISGILFECVCVCVTSLRDLHVKRGHRGRLVDVASLGMSVVDWHGRMEGREELMNENIHEFWISHLAEWRTLVTTLTLAL